MNKLVEKKPILHAVVWIMLYIMMVNIGDGLSEQLGVTNYVTSVFLIGLSVVLLHYLKKNNMFEKYGIMGIPKRDFSKSLFYVPLILLAFVQFSKGIDTTLSISAMGTFGILMICVGFIEELVFRGFLFQGIQRKSGLKKAILISGITFGMGHIVNLFRGYAYEDLIGQIIVAIAIGIMLALLTAITKNIVPGILFHIMFNISGSITKVGSSIEVYLMIAILIICILYILHLSKFLPPENETNEFKNTSMS